LFLSIYECGSFEFAWISTVRPLIPRWLILLEERNELVILHFTICISVVPLGGLSQKVAPGWHPS
jgi:hypothetical protein